jgi:hypothetical protein
MKTRPVGDEFFHAGGNRGMTMLITAFRNFANAPIKRKEGCLDWTYLA